MVTGSGGELEGGNCCIYPSNMHEKADEMADGADAGRPSRKPPARLVTRPRLVTDGPVDTILFLMLSTLFDT